MWRPHSLKPAFLKPSVHYTQPDWYGNNSLITDRSGLQRISASKINQDLSSSREDAFTQIRWATRSTKNHLDCRAKELSLWKTQSAESIVKVDQEICALEQIKATAERCLQEKVQHRHILGECVLIRDGRMAADLVHDHVEAELKKEVELTEEFKELIQKKIYVVLDKLGRMRELRTQLMEDHQDKGKAIAINTQCQAFNLQSPNVGYRYEPVYIVNGTVSYTDWLSHCKSLKLLAEKHVLDCSYFRGNLQYILAKLMNSLDSQRCVTDSYLRRRIHEMTKAKIALDWEIQQVKDTVVELVDEMHKVQKQILTSGTETQLAHTRLDLLKQRPSFELCMDQTNIGLLLENKNLRKNTFGLQKKFLLSQKTLENLQKNLSTLRDCMIAKTHALDLDLKCQEVRRRLLSLRGTAVVVVHSPQTQMSPKCHH
ncbi:tektin-2-like [Aplochiton taeniatus]